MAAAVIDNFLPRMPHSNNENRDFAVSSACDMDIEPASKHGSEGSDDEKEEIITSRVSKAKKRLLIVDEESENEDGIGNELKSDNGGSGPDRQGCIKEDNDSDCKSKLTCSRVKRVIFASGDESSDEDEVEGRKKSRRKKYVKTKENKEDPSKSGGKLKSYEFRSKALAEEELNDDLQDYKDLFQNKDLFSVGESESDYKSSEESTDEQAPVQATTSDKGTSEIKDARKKGNVIKPSVKEKLHTKSEQQRLLRNQPLKISCHQPTPPSLKDFLVRVPCMAKKFNGSTSRDDVNLKKLPKENTEVDVPRLIKTSSEIIFEDTDDDAKDLPSQNHGGTKVNPTLERFLKPKVPVKTSKPHESQSRRNTLTSKTCSKGNYDPDNRIKSQLTREESSKQKLVLDVDKINKEASLRYTPGSRLLILKQQLLQGMKAVRQETRMIHAVHEKEDNEEFSGEEEDEEELTDTEESQSESGDDDESLGKVGGRKGQRSVVNGISDACSEQQGDVEESDDEELKKWNADDSFRQLEKEAEEALSDGAELEETLDDVVVEKTRRTADTSSELLFTGSDSQSISRSSTERVGLEGKHSPPGGRRPSFDWDDSSTIQLAQGEPSKHMTKVNSFSTPFSKLLKSGLLGSTTKRPQNTPREEEDSSSVQNLTVDTVTDEDQNTTQNLHLSLDEDTQFTQILDTQGYLHPRKTSKQSKAKRLFDAFPSSSLSEAIGFCSGDFGSTMGKENSPPFNGFKLPAALPPHGSLVSDKPDGLANLLTKSPIKSLHMDGSWKLEDNAQNGSAKIFELPSGFQNLPDSEDVDEDLIGLCSGKFAVTQPEASVHEAEKRTSEVLLPSDDHESCDDELIALCSGKFFSQSNASSDFEKTSFKGLIDELREEDRPASKNNGATELRTNTPEELLCSPLEKDVSNQQHIENNIGERRHCLENRKQGNDFHGSDESNDGDKKNLEEIGEEGEKEGEEENEEEEEEEERTGGEEEDEEDDLVEEEREEREEDEEDNEDDQRQKEDRNRRKQESSLCRPKFDKKNFYEEEAELSGSEPDSGDEEDLGSEFDEYEVESEVEQLPSDEELWDQVKKVHMKEVLNQDKQELRLYQEMYLEDGDLHSESGGRRRNFRWRNKDDSSQLNLFNHANDSDGEYDRVEEELSQDDLKRKKERFERDTFLMENQKSENLAVLDENSQSILHLIRDTSQSVTPATNNNKGEKGKSFNGSLSNVTSSLKRSGSFLARDQSSLQRLSSLPSACAGRAAPQRAVVFQARSSDDKEGKVNKNFTKRANSLSELPSAKRLRVADEVTSKRKSIFDHL